eukprot:scaffold76160_cov30-Tisochrysis_lutea.AAC.5
MTAEETRIDLIHPVCDDTPTLRVFQGPIEAVHLGSGFAVTGGADQKLRVTSVSTSPDGLKLLIGTSSGSIGVLDVPSQRHATLGRSHTDIIYG